MAKKKNRNTKMKATSKINTKKMQKSQEKIARMNAIINQHNKEYEKIRKQIRLF